MLVEIGVYWYDETHNWQSDLLYQDVKQQYGVDIKINKIYEAFIDSDKIIDGVRYYEKHSLGGNIHCDWEFVNNKKNIVREVVDNYINELLVEGQNACDWCGLTSNYIKNYVNNYVDNVTEKAIGMGLADDNDVINVKYY